MLCEKCQKVEATVYITEVMAGPEKMKKHNLCNVCASEVTEKLRSETAGWTSYDPTKTIYPDEEGDR